MKASILFLALIFLILSCFAFVSSLFIEPTLLILVGLAVRTRLLPVLLMGWFYMVTTICLGVLALVPSEKLDMTKNESWEIF